MGTTLTGTTPQDTYDGLIKVTDNGPLTGSLKLLTDGLGNDSALALSTGAIKVTGAISGTDGFNGFAGATQNLLIDFSAASQFTTLTATDLFFGTNAQERMRITSAGDCGIGTSSPLAKLDVRGTTYLTSTGGDGTLADAVIFGNSGFPNTQSNRIRTTTAASGDLNRISIEAGNGTAGQYINEQLMVTGNGYVRLGSGTGGLQFNGDTAAANALDDYEEGTWTPTTSTAGYTISSSSGRYTKIGRQVTIQGLVNFSAVNGSSNSSVNLTSNPFAPNSIYTGLCRENTSTGAAYVASIVVANNVEINSMDNVTTASQRPIAINEDYIFTITYFV